MRGGGQLGKTGDIVIKAIPMDIKSYAISIIHDQIYGPDTVAIKYAGRGFYIFKTSGTAILEFKDRSLTPYTEICMKAYGYIYIAHLTGKIIGISKKGSIYAKMSHETLCIDENNNQVIIRRK